MKKLLITSMVLIFIGKAFSQQIPIYTQYMFNPFVLNPALAGTHNYYQIRSNHRFQWAGITDPPVTNSISIYGPHGSRDMDMGYGGYVLSDITGPTSKTAAYGSYGYNLPVTDEIRLSMGVSAGIMQYKIDLTKVAFSNEDPVDMGVQSFFLPDASVGLFLYSTNFHVGFSAVQLINNKLKVGEDPTGLSKLKSHFYLTGGYKYFLDRDWAVEPTIIFKKVSPVPLQMDINAKVIYQNMAWGGLSFRTGDAISVLAGYVYDKKIYLGFSYDIGITAIRSYNSGTYELMIGYQFNTIK
ncbi:MAG: type IX secretion system membrane protein PorP/SprF [bacterium]